MSYNLEQQSGINGCFDNPALAIATTTSAFKTANAISYAIAGQIYSKAATDNIAFSAVSGTLSNLSAGQQCVFLVCIDSAGTVKVVQSPIVSSGDANPVPAVPGGYAAIGAIKVNAAATFTVGTTALNAANITTTYFNFAGHPGAAI